MPLRHRNDGPRDDVRGRAGSELIADLAIKGRRLRKPQVVSIGRARFPYWICGRPRLRQLERCPLKVLGKIDRGERKFSPSDQWSGLERHCSPHSPDNGLSFDAVCAGSI